MHDSVSYERAQSALHEVIPRFVSLLRRTQDTDRRVIGEWTAVDVGRHVSHAIELDLSTLKGTLPPAVAPTPTAMAAWNASRLAADLGGSLADVADRIEAQGARIDAMDEPAGPIKWIGGTQFSPTAVVCHLLSELLLHGHDIARAGGAPWRVSADHAALAIMGGGVPIINACPDLWVRDPQRSGRGVRIELHLIGHQRLTLILDRTLRAETTPGLRVDAHLATTPGMALLIFFGRRSPWRVAASGRALVWGRRPDALFTLLNAITSP